MEHCAEVTSLEKQILSEAARRHLPVSGSLELLPVCNMNCDMCYVRLSFQEVEQIGRLRSADEWLALAREMQQAGVLFLTITGGEPLLYPEFRELYLQLLDLGFIITLNTNGTLLDAEWAQFFAAHRPRRINVTLYGAGSRTYEELCHFAEGYERAKRAIILLKQQNVPVKMNISVARKNAADVRALEELAEELQIPCMVDAYMVSATRERAGAFDDCARLDPREAAACRLEWYRWSLTEADFEKYVRQKLYEIENGLNKKQDSHSCMAGVCAFVINWKGEMQPCIVWGNETVPAMERGFLEAWQELRRKLEPIAIGEKCRECPLGTICWNCVASARLEAGAYREAPEYLCESANYYYELLKQEL